MNRFLLLIALLFGLAVPNLEAQLVRYRTNAGIPTACSPPFMTIDTTNNVLYFWKNDGTCGSAADGAIGDAVTGATEGSVSFYGVGGILAQDNTNLFWDNSADRLKALSLSLGGTTDASYSLEVNRTGGTARLLARIGGLNGLTNGYTIISSAADEMQYRWANGASGTILNLSNAGVLSNTGSIITSTSALGTTVTPSLELANSTAATAGATRQFSGSLRFSSSAWDTDGATANTSLWEALSTPLNGNTTESRLSFYYNRAGLGNTVWGYFTDAFGLTMDNPTGAKADGSILKVGANAPDTAAQAEVNCPNATNWAVGMACFEATSQQTTTITGPISIGRFHADMAADVTNQTYTIEADMDWTNGHTIGDVFGLYVHTRDFGTTVPANQYGINVGDMTEGTTNYAIKTGLGLVVFGDNVTLAAGKTLTITGSAGAAPMGAGVCSFDSTAGRIVCGDGTAKREYQTDEDILSAVGADGLVPVIASNLWTLSASAGVLLGAVQSPTNKTLDGGTATTTHAAGANFLQVLEHATDCTAITDGKRGEICLERDSERFFTCQPTAGGCDTAGEWILTGGGGDSTQINIGSFTVWATALDSTTTYYGCGSIQQSNGTAASQRCYISKAGTITAVYGAFSQTAGSAETSTLAIRLNNTTDTTISSAITNDSADVTFNNASMSIAVVPGDYFEIKWTTPAWVTNPTSVRMFLAATVTY